MNLEDLRSEDLEEMAVIAKKKLDFEKLNVIRIIQNRNAKIQTDLSDEARRIFDEKTRIAKLENKKGHK